jgi:hypothetical protein
MPGFFALAAEGPFLRAAWPRRRRIQRLRTPRAYRLRERTKRQRLGRAMSPRDGTRQPPRCDARIPEPGPRFPASGVSARRARCPARLPRIRFEARSWANWFAGHHHRGACAGLSTVAFPEHPSAREMIRGLVQTGDLARRSDSAPRKALRRSSNAAPRCLEPASTTDVSRHEHPRPTPPLETHHRAPWETRRRSTSRPTAEMRRLRRHRPRRAPDHLAVIQPPAAPRLTARRWLRADRLSALALARSGLER